jgi:release factor glutamine methyltransferase
VTVAVPASLTVRDEVDAATDALAAAGVETPRADAEWLLATLLGVSRPAVRLQSSRPLAAGVARAFQAAVRRRAAREPLQRIVGWEEFRGLRLRLTPDVLVPRPETEMLAEIALRLLDAGPPRPRVVDVGTGSGCLACALAHERPDARVIALDVSAAAAAVAADNARALGLADRVRVLVADLDAPLGGATADLLVANLPYLPSALATSLPPEVTAHEPRMAWDGGPGGLAVIERLVSAAPRLLRPAGAVALETAGGPQAAVVAGLLDAAGFADVQVRRDLPGIERFVTGRAKGW